MSLAHFGGISEKKLQVRAWFTRVVKGPMAPACFSGGWGLGASSLEYSVPMEWPLRLQSGEGGEGHQVASAPLRGEQGLRAAGFPDFQMHLGSWLEGWGWVSECKQQLGPIFHESFPGFS